MIALGKLQKEGIDYLDTFPTTPDVPSIQMIAEVATKCDWNFTQFNLQQAFVQCSLDEEIPLQLPQGGEETSQTTVHLSKILHGLRQSPLVSSKHSISIEFEGYVERYLVDPWTFWSGDKRKPSKIMMILAVHVNDHGEPMRYHLKRSFPTNLGELRSNMVCVFDLDWQRGTSKINHSAGIDHLAERFDITTSPTSAYSSAKLRAREEEKEEWSG